MPVSILEEYSAGRLAEAIREWYDGETIDSIQYQVVVAEERVSYSALILWHYADDEPVDA